MLTREEVTALVVVEAVMTLLRREPRVRLLLGCGVCLLRKPAPAFTTHEDDERRRIGVGTRRSKRWERGVTPTLAVVGLKLLSRAICDGGIQGAKRWMRPMTH